MTHRVGTKGQVVIPKEIRDRIGIRPGDEVDFLADSTEVRIRLARENPEERRHAVKALRGAWADGGPGTEELLAERRDERALEEKKADRWGVGRS